MCGRSCTYSDESTLRCRTIVNTSKRTISGKTIMSVVGGLTAILTLGFGLQQLVGVVGGWREQKQRTSELIAVAEEQRESRHYPEAWASLQQAAELDDDNDDVATAREDLAMDWLREARPARDQSFTDFVKPLQPVLQSAALKAEGARKADLLAHAGWADFLRWRDGAHDLAPDAQYQRAIDIDANNPFAHAMWGHWIAFNNGDLAAARQHFDAAMSSNREKEYVRSMQVAAAMNMRGDNSRDEMLRLANEMRQTGDQMDEAHRRRFFWEVCSSDARNTLNWRRPAGRISPGDEHATLRWLIADTTKESDNDMLIFCEARTQAWTGDTARAIATLRSLATNASGDAIRWDAKQVADRLAQRKMP
jgi:hypothetical protein